MAFRLTENLFDKRCAADSHFFWTWRRAIQFGPDFSKYRDCVANYERMQQRRAVKKALDFEKQVQAEFAKAA